MLSSVFLILGGLALFLFGVEETARVCRESLSSSGGAKLARLTSTRTGACLFGALLSGFSQSSVVATSFALGLVDAGLLPYAGAVIVMMGASAGGTMAMFFLSLNVTAWAPFMLVSTTIAEKLSSGKTKQIARVGRGISLIFFGMFILGQGVTPIVAMPWVHVALVQSAGHPWLLASVALLATLVLQSSTAVMALAFTLFASNVISFADAMPIALGTNLGSSVPVFIASLGGRANARRLGTLLLLYKVIGTLAFIPLMAPVTYFISLLPIDDTILLAIGANAVSFFNMFLLMPFAGKLTQISQRWFLKGADVGIEPLHLDFSLVGFSDLALPMLRKEMERFALFLQEFLELLLTTNGRVERVDVFCRELPDFGRTCMRYLRSVPSPPDSLNTPHYDGMLYALLGMRNLSRVLRKELTPVVRVRRLETPPLDARGEWNALISILRKISASVLIGFPQRVDGSSLSSHPEFMVKKYIRFEKSFEEELLSKRIAMASSRDLETLVALGNVIKALVEISKGTEVYWGVSEAAESAPEERKTEEDLSYGLGDIWE